MQLSGEQSPQFQNMALAVGRQIIVRGRGGADALEALQQEAPAGQPW